MEILEENPVQDLRDVKVVKVLNIAGYSIDQALDGEEGLIKARPSKYDPLVLNIAMQPSTPGVTIQF